MHTVKEVSKCGPQATTFDSFTILACIQLQ